MEFMKRKLLKENKTFKTFELYSKILISECFKGCIIIFNASLHHTAPQPPHKQIADRVANGTEIRLVLDSTAKGC